ncbi:MAG: Tn3 family transposase, partial [Acidimicrobiales bacterium]
ICRLAASLEARTVTPSAILVSRGLMVNVIVLWQTVYIQAALAHLAAHGLQPVPADVARLSPLGHPTINLQGRYRTTGAAPTGGLRPLRTRAADR